MVGDDRRSENLHASVGHDEDAHDAAGSADRFDDTLLFARGTRQLQQDVRRRGRSQLIRRGTRMKETHMKQRAMIVVGVAIAVAVLTAVPVDGHHSGSTLFSQDTSTLKGSVAKWVWSNPHCLLTVDGKGDDGRSEEH